MTDSKLIYETLNFTEINRFFPDKPCDLQCGDINGNYDSIHTYSHLLHVWDTQSLVG